MLLAEQAIKKWSPVLDHESLPKIKDSYRKKVTSVLLENQEQYLREAAHANAGFSPAAAPDGGTSQLKGYDPILISLVRRAMPNLIAYDVCGVQPMTGPTGLIFAMKSHYSAQDGTEALFNEADTDFSGTNTHDGTDPVLSVANADPGYDNDAGDIDSVVGGGLTTAAGEALGDGVGGDFAEMAFSIAKVTVTAVTRALKAEYTTEMAQDLKAVHGLDAESELANILSAEILAEINREIIRKINVCAKIGCAASTTTTTGVFDLDTDSNGRWAVEKFKGLLFQIEREANQIAKNTRRGKGNVVLCSSDVASALSMAGVLDTGLALGGNSQLEVDDTGNTFAGTINGRLKVYIDPYFSSASGYEYATIGYRGSSPYDAGLFYCPYVPLQMVRAIGENSFQPKIAFKTRYGLVQNPFVSDDGSLSSHSNHYYRIIRITNLM